MLSRPSVRVYSQGATATCSGERLARCDVPRPLRLGQRVVVMIGGGGWNFPESYPNIARPGSRSPATTGAAHPRRHPARTTGFKPKKTGQVFTDVHQAGREVDPSFLAGGTGPRRCTSSSLHPRHDRDGDAGSAAPRDGDLFGRDMYADLNDRRSALTNQRSRSMRSFQAENPRGLNT